jgi:hypothetical protein
MDYDRAGRLRSVSDASGSRNLTWTDRDQLENDVYLSGPLAGVTITRGYDTNSRLETTGLTLIGAPALRQRTVYDPISWIDYITAESPDGSNVLHTFDYVYKPGTPFIQSVAFFRETNLVMTQTYTRDSLGRLAGAGAQLAGGATLNAVGYQFDILTRRFQADLAVGSRWNYVYNTRSEVTSGKRRLSSGNLAGGQEFEYDYDDIGNRTLARSGGDGTGARLRESTYAPANALNQLTTRTVPGSLWLSGEVPISLTLQGITDGREFSLERQDGDRFFGEASIPNSDSPAYARITIAAKSGATPSTISQRVTISSRGPGIFPLR